MLEEKRFSFFLFTIELRHQRRCKYVSRVVFEIERPVQNYNYVIIWNVMEMYIIYWIFSWSVIEYFQHSKGKNSKGPRTRVEWQELP